MMPLTDRDFAEIRGNVMREIARRQRRNTFVLAASVAFAAVVMVFVLIPRSQPKNDAGRIAGATQKKPAARLSVAPAILPANPVIATQTPPKKRHHRHVKPIAIASAEVPQPMTIELHTANPDVRIIWIAK